MNSAPEIISAPCIPEMKFADALIIVPKAATPVKLPICRHVLKISEAIPVRPFIAGLIVAIVTAGMKCQEVALKR